MCLNIYVYISLTFLLCIVFNLGFSNLHVSIVKENTFTLSLILEFFSPEGKEVYARDGKEKFAEKPQPS